MALGTMFGLINPPADTGETVFPCSIVSDWQTCVDAGGPATRDGAVPGTVVNPTLDITRGVTHIIPGQAGTYLDFQGARDVGLTGITDVQIVVFGRTWRSVTAAGIWVPLPSLLAAAANSASPVATLTSAATDANDGTLAYTMSGNNSLFDKRGNNQFLVGIVVALAGTGVVNNSLINVRQI